MHQRPFCLEQLVERLIQIFPKRSFIMILLFASDKVPSMKTAHKDAKKKPKTWSVIDFHSPLNCV